MMHVQQLCNCKIQSNSKPYHEFEDYQGRNYYKETTRLHVMPSANGREHDQRIQS